jgi:Nif-specific regulatory protein
MGKPVLKISPAVSDILLAYHWPGNVRELENCMERAVLLTTKDTIETIHLPPSLQSLAGTDERKGQGKLNTVIEAQERALILGALKETDGNQTRAAKLLGTTKRIIQYRIQKMGIDPKPYRAKTTDAPRSGMQEE